MNETMKLFHFNSLLFFLLVSSFCLSLCRYPKDTKTKFNNLKSKKASSFHEFACSTSDAWDIDDEENEGFLGTPTPSLLPSDMHSAFTQTQVFTRHNFITELLCTLSWSKVKWNMLMCFTQQQQKQASDTDTELSYRLTPPPTEAQNLQDVQKEDTECQHVNGKILRSSSDTHLSTSSGM